MNKNVFALGLVLFSLFMYRHKIMSWIRPSHIPVTLLQNGSCHQKKLCAIVYLAPWCPACHHYEPMIKKAISDFQGNQEHGIQVIMGMETEIGDNKRKADEISDSVIIDSEKTYELPYYNGVERDIDFETSFRIFLRERLIVRDAHSFFENYLRLLSN